MKTTSWAGAIRASRSWAGAHKNFDLRCQSWQ